MKISTLLLLPFWLTTIYALPGYDCGSRQLNVTTLSLLDVGECEIPEENVIISQKYIQLLQINDYTETTVYQCKIVIKRLINECGMFSLVRAVQGGMGEYIYEISQSECEDVHRTGRIKLSNGHNIQGLRVNQTTSHSLTFAGFLNSEGKCDGAGYSDPYGTWYDVVVQGTITITLQQHIARIVVDNNKIFLRSGTVCTLSDGFCLDMEGGHTFWKTIPTDRCKFNQYGLLYEGYAHKMIDHDLNTTQIIYSLSTQDITFALTAKNKESVCGYNIVRTEHPKLVIFETVKGESFASDAKISVSNLDIFAYVNSKFVYVEKHMRSQLKQLYRDVVKQRCNLERQNLKNSLSIATQSPDEFAYRLMNSPGYMAVVAGEVVHIIKCIPVEVIVEHGEECYAELQVSWKNETHFLTPRTHILKSHGTRITCNALVPSYYFVGQSWYKIMPRPTEAIAPIQIKPNSQTTWVYKSPEGLATSGIYTEKDLRELRDRIMFPVERDSFLETVAREMYGQPVADHERTIYKLLDGDTMSRLAETYWDKLWSRFMRFGTISAGIIAILMILQIFKMIIDIIIRGYTLHSVFGWSFRLLGALWSSVAHCLLIVAQQTQEADQAPRTTYNMEETIYPTLPDQNVTELMPMTSKINQQHAIVNIPNQSTNGTESKPQGYSLFPST